jgi:uncharacterized protein (DUF1800 family)
MLLRTLFRLAVLALGLAVLDARHGAVSRAATPAAQALADDEEARIVHLASRATFGATRELIEEIRAVGRARWLAQQLAPETLADPQLAQRLAIYPALEMDSSELLASYPQGAAARDMSDERIGPPGRVPLEVASDVLTRAVHARAQLAEVMTDFWVNHFNVDAGDGAARYAIVAYVRDAIRPHALGRFADLLRATAESPAMLYYLDNYLSSAPGRGRGRMRGLNENYARELMELHTLGVQGGYTQADVVEVARVFTGWTITPPRSGTLQHVFVAARHEAGVKRVLGRRIAPDGKDEGLQVLELLAREPATAEFVARKLVGRFVADVPPEPLVARARDAFRASDGDVAHVVATILESDEFYAAEHRRAKVKSPLELMASALRAARADVRIALGAVRLVAALGQPILRAEPPTGWKETADAVVTAGGMASRFDVAWLVASNGVQGSRVDTARWSRLASGGDAVAAILREVLPGVAPSAATRGALDEARAAGATPTLLAALALASPEFQQQ